MSWFKRKVKGILTPTQKKKAIPDGLWHKTPKGKIVHTRTLKRNAYVAPEEGYHFRVGPEVYFEVLLDNNKYTELDAKMIAGDPLNFKDTKTYKKRLEAAQKKNQSKDAIRTVEGKIEGMPVVLACMDFGFIGGSMGSVVGEKIARAADRALKKKMPLIIIAQSGGARMMEASFSLMQMAKTSAKLLQLDEAKIPYFSILTHPTTGGVTASFAMLGDFNLAEPDALIGFAGPRIIKETIGKDLPKGFQRSEFVCQSGFVDCIVDRRDLKEKLATLLRLLKS